MANPDTDISNLKQVVREFISKPAPSDWELKYRVVLKRLTDITDFEMGLLSIAPNSFYDAVKAINMIPGLHLEETGDDTIKLRATRRLQEVIAPVQIEIPHLGILERQAHILPIALLAISCTDVSAGNFHDNCLLVFKD